MIKIREDSKPDLEKRLSAIRHDLHNFCESVLNYHAVNKCKECPFKNDCSSIFEAINNIEDILQK